MLRADRAHHRAKGSEQPVGRFDLRARPRFCAIDPLLSQHILFPICTACVLKTTHFQLSRSPAGIAVAVVGIVASGLRKL